MKYLIQDINGIYVYNPHIDRDIGYTYFAQKSINMADKFTLNTARVIIKKFKHNKNLWNYSWKII